MVTELEGPDGQGKLRVGVIGAGFYASLAHIPQLLGTGEVEVTAACRRDAAALAQVADHFGIRGRYTDYRRLLDEAPLDAVVVSSPHALHAEHVRAALERGLPVLTDKPLATATADAEALRRLAAATGCPLLLNVGPPYQPATRYIRACLARGDLGPLHLVQRTGLQNVGGLFGRGGLPSTFPFPVLVPATDFRAHPDLGGGGYFQDVGSHAVAGLLWTTGLRPVEVVAAFDDPTHDARPAVVIRFATGALATLTDVADAFPEESEYRALGLSVYVGGKGSLSTDSRTGQPLRQIWGAAVEAVPAEALPPRQTAAENFVGVLRGREQPVVPVDVAVETVRVVEAAYRSARERRPVALAAAP
jgi:predicted dehydrogenase